MSPANVLSGSLKDACGFHNVFLLSSRVLPFVFAFFFSLYMCVCVEQYFFCCFLHHLV